MYYFPDSSCHDEKPFFIYNNIKYENGFLVKLRCLMLVLVELFSKTDFVNGNDEVYLFSCFCDNIWICMENLFEKISI